MTLGETVVSWWEGENRTIRIEQGSGDGDY